MRIAIYSRKSKWTGKGESIENQLTMCKEYIKATIQGVKDSDFYEYEDEGFSGKNTNRPQFQKMMEDIRKEHYDYLVCYKLDRLGRNLADIATLVEEMNKLEITFISIKEKFDTSTPIGKAMMYFSGVLAQMEREQIAERVRDNMLMLARDGRWLGGKTPLGFKSKKEEKVTIDNRVRTSQRLIEDEAEMKTVRYIFQRYLEERSLNNLLKYFMQNDVKTRNGKDYSIGGIRDILTNPVYCTADKAAYDYFYNLGCQVCLDEEEANGLRGLLGYAKTSSAKYKNKSNPPSEWIISLAKHRGVISGEDWVRVQELLEENKPKGRHFRKVQNSASLLSGVLYCKCGAAMRPKNYPATRLVDGERSFAYLCSCKEKTNRIKCDIPNIHGNTLDKMACEQVLEYMKPTSSVHQILEELKEKLATETKSDVSERQILEEGLRDKKEQIHKLINSLSKSNVSNTLVDYINGQVEQLDEECSELEQKIKQIKDDSIIVVDKQSQIEVLKQQLNDFSLFFDSLSVKEKREYLRLILDKVVWDGEKAHIFIYGSH